MNVAADCANPPDIEVARACLELTAVPSAARQARAFTREALGRWGEDPELIDAAVLIVCELATNAIRHGASPRPARPPRPGHAAGLDHAFSLELVLHPAALRIEVRDGSCVLPVQRTAGRDEGSGRGLMIIAALAESWTAGWDSRGGKWVRATLPRPTGTALGS